MYNICDRESYFNKSASRETYSGALGASTVACHVHYLREDNYVGHCFATFNWPGVRHSVSHNAVQEYFIFINCLIFFTPFCDKRTITTCIRLVILMLYFQNMHKKRMVSLQLLN